MHPLAYTETSEACSLAHKIPEASHIFLIFFGFQGTCVHYSMWSHRKHLAQHTKFSKIRIFFRFFTLMFSVQAFAGPSGVIKSMQLSISNAKTFKDFAHHQSHSLILNIQAIESMLLSQSCSKFKILQRLCVFFWSHMHTHTHISIVVRVSERMNDRNTLHASRMEYSLYINHTLCLYLFVHCFLFR